MGETTPSGDNHAAEDGLYRRVEIINQKGLHARASAKFVNCAAEYDAELKVSKDGMEVVGTSIMGLMMLAASKGTFIEIRASGPQAEAALESICALIAARFDEED